VEPDNLVSKFFKQCENSPEANAFYYYPPDGDQWVRMNWGEYGRQVCALACWMKGQGVKRGDRVALLSGNRPEWMIGDMAILAIGAISIPIYATSSSKDVQYIAKHSGARLFLIDNIDRSKVLLASKVENVVFFDKANDDVPLEGVAVSSFQDIVSRKDNIDFSPVTIEDDDIATIIYTSGTTGSPKGVIHTHGNFDKAARVVLKSVSVTDGEERFFSFLPLSHVAERVLIQLSSIYSGCEVAFARSIANLAEDLVHCRPTILLCVPRLWEKMYEKIHAQLNRASLAKRVIFGLAKKLGSVRIHGENEVSYGMDGHMSVKASDALVGSALRKKLGLDRAHLLLTGSAPTRPEVIKFFASFGLVIREVYGLTENLCLGVFQNNKKVIIGSCGVPFIDNEIKIASDNEIMFRSPWMFKGYYNSPDTTREVLGSDGWFSTGDLGKVDEDGYLRIIGRKKELLKTSTGKYVAPVPIEDRLKSLLGIGDAMVVGDNQKYCVALISLDLEEDFSEDIETSIKDHLSKINIDLANHESIKRVGVLKKGFSVEDGTLTPTMKVKRKVVCDKYQDFIDSLYQASDAVVYEGK